MKPEEMIPLRFGQGNVDWQQRINWEELRKKRVDRAHKFMAKYGIGSAIVTVDDRSSNAVLGHKLLSPGYPLLPQLLPVDSLLPVHISLPEP